eukprot:TRINITY_DN7999_c0_g1_i1.p1 TRINITY_DN7999_c0_g1~~TRINITY_DN7999_c0_g1_i1.p1  ORF type:complete len:456 (+),score=88.90 TRINITY_DN7999_c0_g1_i1:30-1370(+)
MSIETSLNKLKVNNTKLLRVNWLDNANLRKCKMIPVHRAASVFSQGIGLTESCQAVPVMYDHICEGAGVTVVGEVFMIPDPDSVRVVPWNRNHATAMSDIYKVVDGEILPWRHCPRSLLKKVIKEAKDIGIEVNVGIENEFVLLDKETLEPVDQTSYALTASVDYNGDFIDDLADTFEQMEIPLWVIHPESCKGQFEVVINYSDPLTTADNEFYFKEAVCAVADKHGMKAVFLPKMFPDQAGNGMHCHFSVNRGGINLFRNAESPFELKGEAASFVAGILEHLPGLMAISASNPNSYQRLVENCWAGVFSCWGYDNKEAPLRVTRSLTGLNTVEYKTPDQFSNIYLLLASVIACGIDGIKRDLELCEPLQVNPSTLEESYRKENGIERLPANLEDALKAFEEDELLMNLFGEERAQAYLTVKKYELNFFNSQETLQDFINTMIDRQ